MECSLEFPGDAHLAAYLAGTLWFYGSAAARLAEGRHWLPMCWRHRPSATPRGSRRCGAGVRGGAAGDAAAAVAALQELRRGGRAVGDPTAAAYALHRTGCLALVTDDMERAELPAAAGDREFGEIASSQHV